MNRPRDIYNQLTRLLFYYRYRTQTVYYYLLGSLKEPRVHDTSVGPLPRPLMCVEISVVGTPKSEVRVSGVSRTPVSVIKTLVV